MAFLREKNRLNLRWSFADRILSEAGRKNSAPCRVDTLGRSLYLLAFFMRNRLHQTVAIRGSGSETHVVQIGEQVFLDVTVRQRLTAKY